MATQKPQEQTSSSEKNVQTSELVSLKTSGAVLGGFLSLALLLSISTFSMNVSGSLEASLLQGAEQGILVESASESVMANSLTAMFILVGSIFMSIFVLYVLTKAEGQRHGADYYKNTKSFIYRFFPNVFVLESVIMLYVLLIIITAIIFISKLKYSGIISGGGEHDNYVILASIAFSILGGALSQLYYFLNKVKPEELKDQDISGKASIRKREVLEFDVNRVLRYLSFPFMSAGMGIMAYILIKGAGSVIKMDALITPPFWFLMLIAFVAGYFSDLFIIQFQKMINRIEDKILEEEKRGKSGGFAVKKVS
ncbi:hypothetical protein HON22_03695 [Candidatus Peregrinibacteria bacterium]|jgi:hypothetical protein|nr:hypothetical protein [Candidatus Peregrinibacteria bacterium]